MTVQVPQIGTDPPPYVARLIAVVAWVNGKCLLLNSGAEALLACQDTLMKLAALVAFTRTASRTLPLLVLAEFGQLICGPRPPLWVIPTAPGSRTSAAAAPATAARTSPSTVSFASSSWGLAPAARLFSNFYPRLFLSSFDKSFKFDPIVHAISGRIIVTGDHKM